MNFKNTDSDVGKNQNASAEAKGASTSKIGAHYKEYLRATNEDDDGYDPYSDRPVENPIFEEDPWR